MPLAATGNAILLGLGLGRSGEFGVPSPTPGLNQYDAILPVSGPLIPQEAPSGQINPTGFVRAGIPGAKNAPFEFGYPLTAAHMLEFYEHLFGKVVKAEPETGIFEYTFTPLLDGNINTHFWGVFSQPPVEKFLLYGIKFGQVVHTIGDNVEIPSRLTGFAQHGTLLSPAAPDGGNSGTYTVGPWIRGLVADPDAGSIWVRVEALGPPLTFKVLQATSAPAGGTWTAATNIWTVSQDSDGNAIWQNVQASDDGLDLGVWGENKDPLEVIFPGDDTAHGDLAVGDVFEFEAPGAWADPATTPITGAQRFTSAHWVTRFRAIGGPSYEEKAVNSGSITIAWPIEEDRGNLSRYAFDIIRPGQFDPTVTLEKSFVDRFFADKLDRHQRLDMQMAFEGGQLSKDRREGVVLTFPSAAVTGDARPAANAGKTVESVTLRGETTDAGAAPCTAVITTDRDWTPTT